MVENDVELLISQLPYELWYKIIYKFLRLHDRTALARTAKQFYSFFREYPELLPYKKPLWTSEPKKHEPKIREKAGLHQAHYIPDFLPKNITNVLDLNYYTIGAFDCSNRVSVWSVGAEKCIGQVKGGGHYLGHNSRFIFTREQTKICIHDTQGQTSQSKTGPTFPYRYTLFCRATLNAKKLLIEILLS